MIFFVTLHLVLKKSNKSIIKNMNRNTLIGFSLIALVLIVFSYWNSPSQAEIEAYQHEQDSIAAVMEAQKAQPVVQDTLKGKETVAAVDSAALFFPSLSDSLAGSNKLVTLKNDSLELAFNTLGGTIASARILGHKDTLNNMGVQLFTENGQHMDFIIKGLNQFINTRDLYFAPTQEADGSLTMTAQDQATDDWCSNTVWVLTICCISQCRPSDLATSSTPPIRK